MLKTLKYAKSFIFSKICKINFCISIVRITKQIFIKLDFEYATS
jgi:hypothetical protein